MDPMGYIQLFGKEIPPCFFTKQMSRRLTLNPATNQTGSTLSLLRTTDGGLSYEPVIAPFIGILVKNLRDGSLPLEVLVKG